MKRKYPLHNGILRASLCHVVESSIMLMPFFELIPYNQSHRVLPHQTLLIPVHRAQGPICACATLIVNRIRILAPKRSIHVF